MAYQIDNKVLQGNQSLDKVWSSELGKAYYRSRRPTVYATATIDSMIDPQPYSGGHLPYGFCVTDGGNTYQVNNYSGTNEAPPHADWDNLGAGISFTPVSTPADLHAVRSVSTRTFGTGTRWAGEYTTAGPAGHYIQVKDIDLEYDTQNAAGAYYNAGAGWKPIGTPANPFTGRYDGCGLGIYEMLINRPATSGIGMFGSVSGAKIKNTSNITFNITGSSGVGGIVGRGELDNASVLINCVAVGRIHSTVSHCGGVIGYGTSISAYSCKAFVEIVGGGTTTGAGGVGGIMGTIYNGTTGGASTVDSCYAGGSVYNVLASTANGLIGHRFGLGEVVTKNYYNTETSGQTKGFANITDTVGQVEGKTTAELLAGTPSAGIYTDWDTRIWRFVPGRYPVHRFFGELPINLPPPELPVEKITEVTDGGLTYYQINWNEPAVKPLGYNLWRSVDNGAWQKANDELITTNHYVLPNHGYGYLYNFYAIDPDTNGGKSIAPDGWKVPSDDDWKELEMHLGMSQAEADGTGWRGTDEGRKLKSRRTAIDATSVGVPTNEHPRWDYDADEFGTNESGFTALAGGRRNTLGTFGLLGSLCYWWSATEASSTTAWRRFLRSDNAGVRREGHNKDYGFSVRCVRENLTGYTDGERVTDADGNIYDTVKIGDQVWMLQDLVTTKYSDGTDIPNNPDEWEAGAYVSGDWVIHGGTIYQANTNTSEEPPHADWDVKTSADWWAALETDAYCASNNDETRAKLDRPDGLHNYFVVAVYNNKVYKQNQETGNSEVTLEEIV